VHGKKKKTMKMGGKGEAKENSQRTPDCVLAFNHADAGNAGKAACNLEMGGGGRERLYSIFRKAN